MLGWLRSVSYTHLDVYKRQGRYLTVEEEAERQEIEDAKTDPLEDVYDRFAVIDTEDGEYAIWDNQTDDYYVDHEGVTEYFTDEWLANDYLEEVRQSVAAVEAVQTEEPVEEVPEVPEEPVHEVSEWNYQVGDTVYLDDTAFRIEQIKDCLLYTSGPPFCFCWRWDECNWHRSQRRKNFSSQTLHRGYAAFCNGNCRCR